MWRRCVDASGHGQREHIMTCRDQLQVPSRTGEGNFSKESLPETSAKFSTHNVPFTKVCGRVIGYQFIILLMLFVTSRSVQVN